MGKIHFVGFGQFVDAFRLGAANNRHNT
ncbi:uncharacterized protein METZ01_LOCUS487986, partial [marine metagenome]